MIDLHSIDDPDRLYRIFRSAARRYCPWVRAKARAMRVLGYSLEEIRGALGYSSVSSVHYAVKEVPPVTLNA